MGRYGEVWADPREEQPRLRVRPRRRLCPPHRAPQLLELHEALRARSEPAQGSLRRRGDRPLESRGQLREREGERGRERSARVGRLHLGVRDVGRCGEMWGDVGREHLGLAEGRACHRGPPPHRALRHVRLRRDGAKLAPLHEVAGRHARGGPLSPSSTRTARLRHLRETPRSGREDGLVRSTLQSTA